MEAGAVVGELADAAEDQVDDVLADGVVAARVFVGRVLLAADQLLRVLQRSRGWRRAWRMGRAAAAKTHAAKWNGRTWNRQPGLTEPFSICSISYGAC